VDTAKVYFKDRVRFQEAVREGLGEEDDVEHGS
jgi:hypothetical protein